MSAPSLHRSIIRWFVCACASVACVACDLPRDTDGTIDRVKGGVLRVGVVDHPPWASTADHRVSGVEPSLVADLARDLHTHPEWHYGAESALLDSLHERKLDIVIGGLTAESPWKTEVAFTRPYEGGDEPRHVLAVAPGENAWLLRVERYLETHGKATVSASSARARQ